MRLPPASRTRGPRSDTASRTSFPCSSGILARLSRHRPSFRPGDRNAPGELLRVAGGCLENGARLLFLMKPRTDPPIIRKEVRKREVLLLASFSNETRMRPPCGGRSRLWVEPAGSGSARLTRLGVGTSRRHVGERYYLTVASCLVAPLPCRRTRLLCHKCPSAALFS